MIGNSAPRFRVPWPGMVLSGLALIVLLAGGYAPGPVLGIAALWWFSLWLEAARARPAQSPPPSLPESPHLEKRLENLQRDAMNDVIEPASLPLMLTDGQRIVAANAAARASLGAHITGQAARVALRHPDAVKLLEASEGGSVTIRGLTGAGSLWQLNRRPVAVSGTEAEAANLWLIEMIDRTAEADVGRAHTDFVANASHELRTPLASIIGYVETLSDTAAGTGGGLDAETTRRFLGIVLREARRMHTLVADLMSLSQLEAEKHDIPTASLDLGQLAARVVGEFTAPGGIGAGRVALAQPEQPLLVAGDTKQLEQLLRNLIDNGFKYGVPDQTIRVELGLARQGSRTRAQISVTDQGPGIAPEHIPHLTRRFYRTDPGRSRAAGGTGLGLAIVKHIVERHRGRLDIASKLGEGTTVTVRLPLAPLPANETTEALPSLS